MLMREKLHRLVLSALKKANISADEESLKKFKIEYPAPELGDYSSNAALIMSKSAKFKPRDLAEKIIENIDKEMFEKVAVAGPGFINFRLKIENLIPPSSAFRATSPVKGEDKKKILLEYFQPNIAKPLHIGHLETAVIGDAIKRMFLYLGYQVESDTHMGDWGTQFGYLILAQKRFGEVNEKLYAKLNADDSMREEAKQEFVKLEQGDKENRKIWQRLVDTSMQEFLKINTLMDILPFDHHWPESFYEDKMPGVLEDLKVKKLLKESQGAQVVDLEKQGLGVAIIIKSDGGTTYLLRDLATFIFGKQQGFRKHLYVVDNRQSLHYKQLTAILELMGEIVNSKQEIEHIDYGFISFKGEALSTRKGNMVLAYDVIMEAERKVSKLISEKNPGLENKEKVIKAVAKAALKYFILKHNRHSDIEFDWDQVLDFEGNSGPYLQYTAARLSSILKKSGNSKSEIRISKLPITDTERRLLFLLSIFNEKVVDASVDYMPNILANHLFELSATANKFYHESPVIQEKDESKKAFRLNLVNQTKKILFLGLDLLGIKALEEM
ncbi:MAG: arginine--tRNA ligase [Candidatus Doudnabacteria bacterium]|nr:arginine--tRNA ligase [Candidatus Doudnabacteria bacterium]